MSYPAIDRIDGMDSFIIVILPNRFRLPSTSYSDDHCTGLYWLKSLA